MPENNTQNLICIKEEIKKTQLAYILDDCFNIQELIELVEACCPDLSKLNWAQRYQQEWFIHWLTEDFFNSSSSFQLITGQLNQQSELSIGRVGYMNLQEISYFFSCSSELNAQGLCGRVVWALLRDQRKSVQKQGISLLQTCNYSDIILDRFKEVDRYSLIKKSPYHERNKIDLVIEELKSQLSELEIKNDMLKQENRELKGQLEISTQEYTRLEKSNDNKKKDLVALEDYEAHVSSIEFEKEQLRQDLARQSLRLGAIQQFQNKRTEFDLELSALEDLQSRTDDTFHQMMSEFQSSIDKLEWLHDSSKKTLESTRRRLFNLTQDIDPVKRHTNVSRKINSDYLSSEQPRVAVFVDVQNMFYAAKDRYASRLDYIKLLDLTVGPRYLVAAYAYIVQIPEIDQSGFLSLLEHNGYRIKSKDLRLRGDGSAKGDWDVGIAIDVVSMLDVLDVVILASGDGDFCPLADLIQKRNKQIEVIAFEHNTAMDLQRKVDKFYPVSNELLI